MKTTLFFVALLVAAFTIGCEVKINQVQPDSGNYVAPHQPKILEFQGTTEILGKDGVKRYFEVSGRATYTFVKVQGDLAKGTLARETYEVTITTEAELKSLNTESVGLSWKAAGSSVDRIAMDDNGNISLVKKYQILRMDKEPQLNLEFDVAKDNLSFSRMWVSGF